MCILPQTCLLYTSCCALITDMDVPLGHAVGNALEIKESIEVLKGGGPSDLREVSLGLAANMLYMAEKGTIEECRNLAESAIQDGSAFEALLRMVEGQGGDKSYACLLYTSSMQKAMFQEA